MNDAIPPQHRRRQTDYSQVDWSKSNSEIAAELQVADALVWAARRRALALAEKPAARKGPTKPAAKKISC